MVVRKFNEPGVLLIQEVVLLLQGHQEVVHFLKGCHCLMGIRDMVHVWVQCHAFSFWLGFQGKIRGNVSIRLHLMHIRHRQILLPPPLAHLPPWLGVPINGVPLLLGERDLIDSSQGGGLEGGVGTLHGVGLAEFGVLTH